MSLRIAHVTATFPPYRGGTGNVCFHNARELAARGHEVHVFTAAGPNAPARELLAGVQVHRLRPIVRVGNAPVLPGLLAALRGFDVVHLHYPFFGGELSALAARLRSTPLFITYHQDVLLHGAMGVAERVLRHTIGRTALRSADRVFFTSRDYGQASYVQPLLRGRDGHIGEVPNGVDVEAFTPGAPTAALQHAIGPQQGDKVALLVAGLDRAHYFKGVPVFLEALAGLPPNMKGVIVGDGDLRAEYERMAAGLCLDARVTFAGRVADADLPDYYRLADVTVLPSTTMGEAFGLVLVESMACGTPVIASSLPGVRTVVQHGRNGLLVPPGDAAALSRAIARICADMRVHDAMGIAGRAAAVARYSWVTLAALLEQEYNGVLARRGRLARHTLRGER
jgi:glycosyltransferase involved in cell wall biosynthesis